MDRNLFAKTKPESIDSDEHYCCLFENNHIVMLLIEPDTAEIIEANAKACSFYGYSQEELKGKKITDFNVLSSEQVFCEMEKARNERRSFFVFQHRLANGQVRDVEVYSGPIRRMGRDLLYSIIIDISQRIIAEAKVRESSELLQGVLQGVPDIIGVYKPDHSILFYNQAGYSFFNINNDEVQGKKCFEVLGRNKHCEPCGTKNSINSKRLEVIQRYIPEIDRFMDCRYNPILNEKGEVVLIVEQLRDITEQKKAELSLIRSEESYRNLFDLSPDGMGVLRKGQIINTNIKLVKILGEEKPEDIIGKAIFDYIEKDYIPLARQRLKNVMVEGNPNTLKEYKFRKADGKSIDVEVASAPFTYQGRPAIQFVLRDITERKRQLERAALIQRQRLDSRFPLLDKGALEVIYQPADGISGDFFHLVKVNENKVLGLLGDISGKGISAAISTSALEVLFSEIAQLTSDPLKIVNHLNQEVPKYLGEEYVAAICFSLDFEIMEAMVSGAGINSYMYYKEKPYCVEETIKGPSLGMLEQNLFEEKRYTIEKGDRFYFYTDGLEGFFTERKNKNLLLTYKTIEKQKKHLSKLLSSNFLLKDDTTWLAIEIK